MRLIRLMVAACIAVLATTFAPSASAVVGGDPDKARDYVVFVGQILPNGARGAACSGTLISPTVVVTAAHCGLLSPTSAPDGQTFVVRQGETIFAPERQVTGTFYAHPDFCVGCGGGLFGFVENDLAVIVLDEPLRGPYAKLPKPDFVAKHYAKPKQLVVAGFGISDPATGVGFGTRRAAPALAVVSQWPDFLELQPPTKSKYGVACQGDSGGPNLNGNTIVAVNSIGETSCGGPSYSYRLDTEAARSFLARFVDLKGSTGDE